MNEKETAPETTALINTTDKVLKTAMAQVTLSEKITDGKLADALKKSAVYTATGAKSQSLLWISLADAKALDSWKKIQDSEGKEYKNFAKFALDFVPGLARETKESSIRAYLAAGEVLRAVPELQTKSLSSDALNSLHSMISTKEGISNLKAGVENGDFDFMTNAEAREYVKKYAGDEAKSKKAERLYKVSTEKGEILLYDKKKLLSIVETKKKLAGETKSGKEYCHFFSVSGFYLFEVDGKGGAISTFAARETEEEAAKRVGDAERAADLEARKESRMNQLSMELGSLFKSLVDAGIPKEMAESAALNQLCVLHPAEAEDFKAWLERAPLDTEAESSSKN